MIRIITRNMELKRHSNDILDITPASGSIYIKFSDGSEFIYPVETVKPEHSALLNAAKRSTAKEIVIDFTSPNRLVQITK